MDVKQIALEVLKDAISGKNILQGDNYTSGIVEINNQSIHIEFYTLYGTLFACDLYPTPFEIKL